MASEDRLNETFLVAELTKIFKPSAPTSDRELFRGRQGELERLALATQEQGQHAILFGERGVGKTSLAYMGMEVFRLSNPLGIVVRIACTADDSFSSLWKKLATRAQSTVDKLDDKQLRELYQPAIDRVREVLASEDRITPEDVGRALDILSAAAPLLVVIDEFDRIADFSAGAEFADLIKQISDDLLSCTLCIVGVADDVSGLMAGHESVDRSLKAIAMPRMSTSELRQIVEAGFEVFRRATGYEISVTPAAVAAIANMSQGFPYYTHLLASAIGRLAITSARNEVQFEDVFSALLQAKNEAEPGIKNRYREATFGRTHATYRETLLACVLAKSDHLGYFAASDVTTALRSNLNSPRKNCNAHLKKFSEEMPMLLEKQQNRSAAKHRFADPLMRPFVLLEGFSSGMIRMESLENVDVEYGDE